MSIYVALDGLRLDHLRHHERVTQADRDVQMRVHALHVGAVPPRVAHYLAFAATSRSEPTGQSD